MSNIEDNDMAGPSETPKQSTAAAATEKVSNVDLGDLDDIAKTCQYISNVVTNLNKKLSRVPPNIKTEIDNLNSQLLGVIGGADNSPSSVTDPTSDGAGPDRQQTHRKFTNVRIRGERHSKDTSSSSNYLPPNARHVYNTNHKIKNAHRKTRQARKSRVQRREHSSSSDSYDVPQTCNLRKSRARVKNRSGLKSSNSVLSAEQVAQLMTKFDTRIVPKPEQFDASSGQSFKDFLALFEEYCQHTFRGSSSLWVGELGRFLTGEMHKAFQFLKVPGDSYESIKSKLIKWRKDSHEVYDIDKRSRFTNARMESGESLRLFATRLEKTFRIAYPSHSVQKSRTLREKFMGSIPDSFRKQLYNARSMSLAMNDKELSWSNILSLASRFDTQSNTDLVVEDDSAVWVNHSLQNYNQPHAFHNSSQKFSRPHVWYSNPVPHSQPSTNPYLNNSRRNYSLGRTKNGKPFHAQLRSKSAVSAPSGNIVCFHCNKPGHFKSQCRRYLKLCLVCGSADHLIATCPQRREPFTQPSNLPKGNSKSQFSQPAKKALASPILNAKAL